MKNKSQTSKTTGIEIETRDGPELTQAQFDAIIRVLADWLIREYDWAISERSRRTADKRES